MSTNKGAQSYQAHGCSLKTRLVWCK